MMKGILKNKIIKIKWWKKLVLLILIATAVVLVWKVTNKPYYTKDSLCYSNFLENCEGKKVEVEGKIVKGSCGVKTIGEPIKAYFLDNINIPPCKLGYEAPFFPWEGPSSLNCQYLSLFQSCYAEDAAIEINNEVERLLPNPEDKTVKIVGKVFVERTPPRASVYGVVGIIPESITVIGG
ncbi:MAG: hypothetical protein Q8O03_00930 [Nanoarchaeota archaeon]|nr:hypothetical protein [Nanoarchaeota archaeon]